MTLAIGHQEGDTSILDLVRERKPPFSPESVVQEFVADLRRYSVSTVYGDRYAGMWPRERFSVHGIDYETAEKNRSALYLELLALVNSGRCELLDHSRLISQLCALERRTGRGKDSVDHGPGAHDDVISAWELLPLDMNEHSSDLICNAADGSYVERPKPAAKFIAQRKLWLTADRCRLVADGDLARRFLFCIPGREVALNAALLAQATRDRLIGNEGPKVTQDEPSGGEEVQPETVNGILI